LQGGISKIIWKNTKKIEKNEKSTYLNAKLDKDLKWIAKQIKVLEKKATKGSSPLWGNYSAHETIEKDNGKG
jgi:hypothetical protein